MTKAISQRELRDDSGAILRAVDRGEDFLVTRDGVPIAELRPIRQQFVSRSLLVAALRDAPAIDEERFRADINAILDLHAV